MSKRPPIGIMPAWLWLELNKRPTAWQILRRLIAVASAILRYKIAGMPIPKAWVKELVYGANTMNRI